MATIGFFVYDGVQALDVTGPMDVFAAANNCSPGKRQRYSLCTIALAPGPIRTEAGLTIVPDAIISAAPALDTLVIPGGTGSRRVNTDAGLLAWIRLRAESTRRIVSICTGLYILGATGLLDDRRVTTHWQHAADAAQQFAGVRMDADQLFVRDGKFYTSGGLTAGLDLALALVEEDFGATVALAVARELVMYMKRPGNQAQFSAPLQAQTSATGRMRPLVDWLLEHLDEDLGVDRLADRMAMSERHFRRVFGETFAATSASFVERLRLERACELLTSGVLPIERVATAVGFASADAFRRAFRKRYRASPREYRERFSR